MFKEIERYPGYKVNENGIVINKKGHVMRPGISNVGRPRVSLETYDENGKLIKRTNESVYRLVAETFIPNPDNLPLVMHKDNDVFHSHVSNLKWGTQKENVEQAYEDGLMKVVENKRKYVYKVYNDDKTDIIECKGCEGVAKLIGFGNPNSVRPGKILSGPYKGYNIENTGERCKVPVYFVRNYKPEPQLIE